MSVTQELTTVVVPIRNEVRSIDTTLSDIVAQTYENLEVLVVDGESDDGTRELLERWVASDDRIRVLTNPKRTAASALNVGLAEARGQWLIRVDGHVRIPSNYVEVIVGHLASGRWGGVGGRKDAVGSGPAAEAISAVLGSPWGVGGSRYHYAQESVEVDHVPFGAYPVELARELGGWDQRLVANQDFEFDARVREAGYRLLVDPAIATDWHCRERIVDLARQYLRYGRGKADVARLHPRTFRVRHGAPPALVASLLVGVVIIPWSKAPLVILLTTYGLVVVVASAAVARSVRSGAGRIRVPAALVTTHVAWGTGFWMGVARLARHGFRVPNLPEDDLARWGSPRWDLDLGSDAIPGDSPVG